MPTPLHGIPVAPLTSLLDLRSPPDLMGPGTLRFRQNFQCVDENKLRRGAGWSKLFTAPAYNNQDFHDQLLVYWGAVGTAKREPITMIMEAESSRSMRSLIIGTQSRIARLNEVSGNWQILGTGFGGAAGVDATGPRFQGAVLGDYLVLTNDFDKPKYLTLESSYGVTNLVAEIPDLAVIGLTRAARVWVWRNCIFLADVDMDAETFSYRIVWSDYNGPISFDPSLPQSITGFKDLDFGERVLGFKPTYANTGLIYTNKGVWEISVVGGDQSFAFRRVYDGEPTDLIGTLYYPNTLMNLGDAHLYAGRDRFYMFSPYYSRPEPLEWLHRADSVLYDRVRDDACEAHVAEYYGTEAYISFLTKDSPNGCPNITLRVNMRYKVADIVDHGFTALASYRPQKIPSIRDFILDNKICDLAELTAQGYGFINEGLPNPMPDPSAAFEPQSIYTKVPQSLGTSPSLEAPQVPTLITRVANVATMTVPAHGYSTGDLIQILGVSDPSFNAPNGVTITVIDADNFTYPSTGLDTQTQGIGTPFVSKIGAVRSAVAIIQPDAVVTVKLTAHGFSNGDLIKATAQLAGNPALNTDSAPVTVVDADTFTYPTTATAADTAYGAQNIVNVVPANQFFSLVSPPRTNYLYSLDPLLTPGVKYTYRLGDFEQALFLVGSNTNITGNGTVGSFVYDGLGAVIYPNIDFSVTTSLQIAAGDTFTPNLIPGGTRYNHQTLPQQQRYSLKTMQAGQIYHFKPVVSTDKLWLVGPNTVLTTESFFTYDGSIALLEGPSSTNTLARVTAIVSGGLAMNVSKLSAKQFPTQVERVANPVDPTLPPWAVVTLAAHGYIVGDVLSIDGFSDGSFNNTNGATLIAVTADTFTYISPGTLSGAANPNAPTVRKIDLLATLQVEDWNQPTADADSLCALLAGASLHDLCRQCQTKPVLIGASYVDWCLKQIGDVFYRERVANPDAVGVLSPCIPVAPPEGGGGGGGPTSVLSVAVISCCPQGMFMTFLGTPPSWITLDFANNCVIGNAGAFSGATQAEADDTAQAALDAWVSSAQTAGTLRCNPPQIPTPILGDFAGMSIDALEGSPALFPEVDGLGQSAGFSAGAAISVIHILTVPPEADACTTAFNSGALTDVIHLVTFNDLGAVNTAFASGILFQAILTASFNENGACNTDFVGGTLAIGAWPVNFVENAACNTGWLSGQLT